MDVQEIISSGLLELHAAGLTSQEEGLRVQQWIKEYPEIAKAYDEIEKDIESYALANAIAPSAAVKGKIFSALNFDAAENNEASDSLTFMIEKFDLEHTEARLSLKNLEG